jgi:hypothetical protein
MPHVPLACPLASADQEVVFPADWLAEHVRAVVDEAPPLVPGTRQWHQLSAALAPRTVTPPAAAAA